MSMWTANVKLPHCESVGPTHTVKFIWCIANYLVLEAWWHSGHLQVLHSSVLLWVSTVHRAEVFSTALYKPTSPKSVCSDSTDSN